MPNPMNLTRRGFVETTLAASAAAATLGATTVATNVFAAASPIVKTKQGAVRGVVENGVAIFRGMPYAEPPVGKLRFKPPVRVARWEGVRDATWFGDVVPQTDQSFVDTMIMHKRVPQGDDCLNLNVWTPAPGRASLPVLVWIHGGSFKWGSGSVPLYDGMSFARDGIVVVTINYRLGASGFLNVGDQPGSGCFGLLDQVAALQWVQENIAAFGGDPSNVTIAGQSAGGFSVGQLLALPAARGLYRRAICQSGGTALSVRAEAGEIIGKALLAKMGLKPNDAEGIAAIKSKDLLAAQIAAEPTFPQLLQASGIAPDPLAFAFVALTPNYGGDTQPVYALEAIAQGSAKGVDLLVGWTADETNLFYPKRELAAAARPSIETAVGYAFGGRRSGADVLQAYRALKPGSDIVDCVPPCATALLFGVPVSRLVDAASAQGSRTHFYRFSWGGALGAVHGLEVALIFDTVQATPELMPTMGVTNVPRALIDSMHGSWANFIKTGSPQHSSLPAWPTYDAARRAAMDFNTPSRVVDDINAEERKLWASAKY